MKNISRLIVLAVLALTSFSVDAQPKIKIVSGVVSFDDGSLSPNEIKYTRLTDSLNRNLKDNPNDTTSLLYRSMLYVRFNSLIAKPFAGAPGALDNLKIARDMVEKAVELKMKSIYLMVLRAQLYKELAYRYSGDQAWNLSAKQIADHRAVFNNYKNLANKYYDELAERNSRDAYDYHKLKVTYNYPIR